MNFKNKNFQRQMISCYSTRGRECRQAMQTRQCGGIPADLIFCFFLIKKKEKEKNHYPEMHIINMNARLYDPVIARFFSPDNFIQIPENSQALNRYSYCLNNPLKYKDPTGWLYNPIYNTDGIYLGDTKEGFTGAPLIYEGKSKVEWSKMTADDACNLFGLKTYDAARGNLSGMARSNIWTDIVSKFEGKDVFGEIFSMSSIRGGRIYFEKMLPNENWSTAKYILSGGNEYSISGSDNWRDYETTVENVQASVIFHEWYGHVKNSFSERSLFPNHHSAYDAVMDSPIYSKTTPNYQSFTESQRKIFFDKHREVRVKAFGY